MVDDNLVESDKIGIGAFFWALPSQGLQKRKNAIEDYDKKIDNMKKEVENKQKLIKEAIESREEGEGGSRQKMIDELAELRKKKTQLAGELKNYERSDPKQLLKMQDDMKIAKDAVNRWTDNLSLVLEWIQETKPGISQEDIAKQFPVFKHLDYME